MSESDLNKPPFEHVVLCASLGLFSEEHPVSAMAPEREKSLVGSTKRMDDINGGSKRLRKRDWQLVKSVR
jgi:hypothetical protein